MLQGMRLLAGATPADPHRVSGCHLCRHPLYRYILFLSGAMPAQGHAAPHLPLDSMQNIAALYRLRLSRSCQEY